MQKFFKDVIYDDEIVEINYIGEEDTIDINISGNRLYWANGLLTHNSSFDEIEYNLGNIAGGISKANSADNLFGIFTSRIMKERGAIQLQFLKTRNSSGVGQKVDLDFNVDSLRITDSTSSGEESSMVGNNILSQIKNAPKPTINLGENKQDMLKNLLSSINKKS